MERRLALEVAEVNYKALSRDGVRLDNVRHDNFISVSPDYLNDFECQHPLS